MYSPTKIVTKVKSLTAKQIFSQVPSVKKQLWGGEFWSDGYFVSIIFFALLIGVSLLSIGESGKPVADFMAAAAVAMLRITHWIMEAAPFGAFALIAQLAGTAGGGALIDVLTLALAVVIGCAAHMIFMHGFVVMRVLLNLSGMNFFRGSRDAMLMAFSTSSSSATLPISMTCAEENLGVKPVIASTVLPLGATINICLLYTSPRPRDATLSRMPSSA